MKKLFAFLALMLALILLLTALPVFGETKAADNAETAATAELSAYFSDRDLSGDWDESGAVRIALEGDGASCDSAAVRAEGGVVTITGAGTYVLTGSLAGSVVVNAGDADKVQLVLAGVVLTPPSGAAIVVESADKVFVTLAEGTENTLTCDVFDESSDIDAAIFARDDIAFNGTGTLIIASAKHGIVGKDDVKFASGSYDITAGSRGIDANDSVRVADGTFAIVAGKDGIRARNDEDAEKGYVIVFGGSFDITTGGGAQNAAAHSAGMMGFGRQAASADEGDSTSAKGLKASGDLTILGGVFTVDAADDAFHTDRNLTVAGGSLTAASGDDGMHANETLAISGGVIDITQSYEGIEGTVILISGGDIAVTAADDGLNAAGGNDSSGYGFYDRFGASGTGTLTISGGSLRVNASGDGLDSNGDLYVSGGVIVVSGPTNSGNGALDYGEQGRAVISGGTLIATGAQGMASNFGADSTQVSALVSLNGSAGEITVMDAEGKVLLSGTVDKSFECVVISSPALSVGETYTVASGSARTAVEITGTVVGAGMGFGGQMPGGAGFSSGEGQGRRGGFGGGRGGMGGQMPGGRGGNPDPSGEAGQSGDDAQDNGL